MACKTCDHTMQGLGKVESGARYFWCPRCGTLKEEGRGREQSDVPRAWTRAMKVLRRLVAINENGRPDPLSEDLNECAGDADKILRDCDPERR